MTVISEEDIEYILNSGNSDSDSDYIPPEEEINNAGSSSNGEEKIENIGEEEPVLEYGPHQRPKTRKRKRNESHRALAKGNSNSGKCYINVKGNIVQ
ncbi:hypothetical protein J6590_014310, partial [Homalodisca vitripennis]